MILATVSTYSAYGLTDSELKKYVEVLRSIPKDAKDGKTELEDGAFYSVQTAALRSPEGKDFEAHKHFIDIQYVIDGTERIDYADVKDLTETVPYSSEKDVMFLSGNGSQLILKSGDFAVFTPTDAHLPCIGEGKVKKAVVKVPVK